MASRKYGEMVGSPPENCTDICRRGLMEMALSSSVLMSSHVSSCTNPTWLASMKHGSHIMLQRLVRSIVSTEPRPCLMVLVPWLCSFSSLCARMSRPGKTSSRCLKKSVSMAMTSSKWPCLGQSFTIKILPSRSTICALISPGRSVNRTRKSCLPSTICRRISGTQRGHKESVSRGQPRGGFDFSRDFSSGLSDHFGVKDGFSGTRSLMKQNVRHNPLAAMDAAFSRYLMGLCISQIPSSRLSLQLHQQNFVTRTGESAATSLVLNSDYFCTAKIGSLTKARGLPKQLDKQVPPWHPALSRPQFRPHVGKGDFGERCTYPPDHNRCIRFLLERRLTGADAACYACRTVCDSRLCGSSSHSSGKWRFLWACRDKTDHHRQGRRWCPSRLRPPGRRFRIHRILADKSGKEGAMACATGPNNQLSLGLRRRSPSESRTSCSR